MVQNDVAYRIASQGVVAVIYVGRSSAEAHVSNDDVVGVDFKSFTGNTDAVSGGALSGYGQVGCSDVYGCFKMNDSGYIKYDNAGSALFTGPAKGSFA